MLEFYFPTFYRYCDNIFIIYLFGPGDHVDSPIFKTFISSTTGVKAPVTVLLYIIGLLMHSRINRILLLGWFIFKNQQNVQLKLSNKCSGVQNKIFPSEVRGCSSVKLA